MTDPAQLPGDEVRRSAPFGGIGWLLLLLALMVVALLAWRIPRLIRAYQLTQSGGPSEENLNGFTLEPIFIDRQELLWFSAADEVHPIDDPQFLSVDEALSLGRRFLVDSSIVIGVEIDGEARAYPERVVQVHEVVNDTIDGIAIAVVHQPLIGLSAVFERPGDGSNPVLLGNSGILVDSCPLLHDRLGAPRRDEETLWSPLRRGAVAGVGAEAGKNLRLIPHRRISWKRWRQEHPSTKVLAMEPSHKLLYRKEPFNTYRFGGTPRFPVNPLPPDSSTRTLFASMLIVPGVNGDALLCLEEIFAEAQEEIWDDPRYPGIELVLDFEDETAWARDPSGILLPSIEVYWFACFAHLEN